MRRGVKDLVDEILLLQPRPLHPPPAACLSAERIGLYCLDVTSSSERDNELFVLDEVLDEQLTWIVDDTGPPWLCVLLLDRLELGRDHRAEPKRVTQNRLELLDRRLQLGHLGLELAAAKPRQSTKGHVQDVVRLLFAEGERLAHEVSPRIGTVLGGTDSRDHRIEHVDGTKQPLDYVRSCQCLAKAELRPPRDNLHLMRDVGLKSLSKIEKARHTVDEGQHVYAEGRLQRRVLVEVVKHDVGVRIALQCDDEA